MYNMFGLDDEVALSVVLVALCQWHDPVAFCRAFFQSNLITALYSLVGGGMGEGVRVGGEVWDVEGI